MLKNWLNKITGSRSDIRKLDNIPLEIKSPKEHLDAKSVEDVFDEAVKKVAYDKVKSLIEKSLKEEIFSKEYMDQYLEARIYISEHKLDLDKERVRNIIKKRFPLMEFKEHFEGIHREHYLLGTYLDIDIVLNKLTNLYMEECDANFNKS